MQLLIVQTGEPLPTDAGNPRPMRAMNLANVMIQRGHQVTIISSGFYHQQKEHRSRTPTTDCSVRNLEVQLIPSPGYKRNIGLGRLIDHAVLGLRLKSHLAKLRSKPDVVFVGFPPIETAYVTVKWAKMHGLPCVVDVKDQWPSLFVEFLPRALRPLGKVALFPYFALAKAALAEATAISTMADDFLTWALAFAGRDRNDSDGIYPLTTPDTDLSQVEIDGGRRWCESVGLTNEGVFRILFVGSHMSVFDFQTVAVAARTLSRTAPSVQFVICGDGGYSDVIRNLMKGLDNVVFPGWVDRPQILALAERSHASIAPYNSIDNFEKNIPNKIIDYLSLGLPLLSPLKGEVERLVVSHRVGVNYGASHEMNLEDAITMIRENNQLRKELSMNARELYQRKFNFEVVYGQLVDDLEKLAGHIN